MKMLTPIGLLAGLAATPAGATTYVSALQCIETKLGINYLNAHTRDIKTPEDRKWIDAQEPPGEFDKRFKAANHACYLEMCVNTSAPSPTCHAQYPNQVPH